jgi:hypothetical protein
LFQAQRAWSQGKAEMIKWTFLFWIGQMAATAAIVKFLSPQ